jgi:hypothetical protein
LANAWSHVAGANLDGWQSVLNMSFFRATIADPQAPCSHQPSKLQTGQTRVALVVVDD